MVTAIDGFDMTMIFYYDMVNLANDVKSITNVFVPWKIFPDTKMSRNLIFGQPNLKEINHDNNFKFA